MKQFKIGVAPRLRTMADGTRMEMTRPRVALAVFAAFGLVVAACSDDDNNNDAVTAEFTGDDCVYSGPTEFQVGEEFEITVVDVTEERMGPGYAVTKVPDGTSVEEALEEGFIENLPEDGPGTFLWSEVTEVGTERAMSITLDVAGTWLVHCFGIQNPETDGEVFPATTFEVVAES